MHCEYMELSKVGFVYEVELIRGGAVIDYERTANIVPTEGLNFFLNSALTGGVAYSAWYVGIFENNYTPLAGDTMVTFLGGSKATECTAYTSTNRISWVYDTVASGAISNTTTKAEFTMNATKTIYGGFLTQGQAKGATTGPLVSAVKFSAAKSVESGDILRILAGITMTST